MAEPGPVGRASEFPAWLPVALILAAGSPTLFLAYLPMTDLPQHLAVASMLLHWGDPQFGFDEHFELALTRTLYLLPYGVVVGLAHLMPIAIAMRVLVFASVVAYPLGVLAVLRATGRPGALALLAVPLLYDRAFFWGFVNFELALGMALFAIAGLERDRQDARAKLALAALCAAIPFTHVYGIAIVAGYVCFWLVVGERRKLVGRALPLLPLALGGVAWGVVGSEAQGRGAFAFDPLGERLLGFGHAVFGNYTNPSDELLFAATLIVAGVFCVGGIPWSAARWRAASRPARVAFLLCACNFALYWTLPTHTETALFIHFRHGLLAVALLPLFASPGLLSARPRAAAALLLALALGAATVHTVHLVRFDREARAFDDVVAQLPPRPRVCFLAWERRGRVIRSSPYHHFHAYILAQRGGVISYSFPELFWNIPVRLRRDSGVPGVPTAWQWRPELFDAEAVSGFYDWVLVRRSRDGREGPESLDAFPYELVYANPPWELHARRAAPAADGS